MSFAIAATVGTIASTAGSIYAGRQSSNAISGGSKRALRYQAVEADKNRAFQREILDQQRADFAPWREAGASALGRIMEGLSRGDYEPPRFDARDIDLEADPGYQFRMDAGQNVIENSAAARGGVLSGQQLRELTRYGQDFGTQEYGNAYARHADQVDREGRRRATRFNQLALLAGQGLGAAGSQAAASGNSAAINNSINQNQANQGGQLLYNQGVARADGINATSTAVNQGLQNWLTYRQSQPTAPPATTTPQVATNQGNMLRWNRTILD